MRLVEVSGHKKVSVVIPCFNAQDFVQECVESVLGQREIDLDIVLVDDGSTDKTLDIARRFTGAATIIGQKNQGACVARNRGFEKSTGDYVMFLDADDLLEENTLGRLVDKIDADEAGFVGCGWDNFLKIAEIWARGPGGHQSLPSEGLLEAWLTDWYLPPCCILWRRSTLLEVGGWDESLTANQDGEIVMRALLKKEKFSFANFVGALHRDHGDDHQSISKDIYSQHSLESRMRVLGRVEDLAVNTEYEHSDSFRVALGRAYYSLARKLAGRNRELFTICSSKADRLGGRMSNTGSVMHRIVTSLVGLENKERLVRFLRDNDKN
jgi:O-antigen biosynthesis protein